MTTAVAPVPAPESWELIALDRPQLESAHRRMIEFVDGRLLSIQVDLAEEREALAVAQRNKWAASRFQTNVRRLERRAEFFEKIKAAVEAGHVILPNLAMQVFAIRTSAKGPRGKESTYHWQQFVQSAQLLPAGEGRYVSPIPAALQRVEDRPDGKGGTTKVTVYWPDEFTDVDFPMVMAKPALMNAAGQAMALRIFDEIGIAVDGGGKKPDPVLMGRIKNPGRGADISFHLGWYFDPSVL